MSGRLYKGIKTKTKWHNGMNSRIKRWCDHDGGGDEDGDDDGDEEEDGVRVWCIWRPR